MCDSLSHHVTFCDSYKVEKKKKKRTIIQQSSNKFKVLINRVINVSIQYRRNKERQKENIKRRKIEEREKERKEKEEQETSKGKKDRSRRIVKGDDSENWIVKDRYIEGNYSGSVARQ